VIRLEERFLVGSSSVASSVSRVQNYLKKIFTLFSPRILMQLAVLQPTNALFVFLLQFYTTYVSAVVQPSSRYTSMFTSLALVHLVNNIVMSVIIPNEPVPVK
jgi:hypothetical protein